MRKQVITMFMDYAHNVDIEIEARVTGDTVEEPLAQMIFQKIVLNAIKIIPSLHLGAMLVVNSKIILAK
jgi:hypothetical protein